MIPFRSGILQKHCDVWLVFLQIPHQRFIMKQSIAYIRKLRLTVLHHKILHMDGADPVSVKAESLIDHFVLIQIVIRTDQVHRV